MERALSRLADTAARRRRTIVAVWLVLLLGSGWFSLHQSERLSGGGWEVPGSESVRGTKLIEEFPAFDGVRFAVLVESPAAARTRAAAGRARARLERFPDLRSGGPPRVLEEGRALLLPLLWSGETQSSFDFAAELRDAVVSDAGGARTRVIGEPAVWSNFQEVSKRQLTEAETIGLPLVLAILLAAFGTLVAAAMPLALGVAAVTLTGAVIYALAGVAEMSIYVTNMASMIGIGVAVDYSLFVVSRFRHELAEGREEREALRGALASAGTAVVFSGLTVVVSLGSLFLVPVNAVRSMAAGAIVVVTIAVLATVTLLPALLALLGRRIERVHIGLPGRRGEAGGDFWLRWSERVMRHPVAALGGGTAAMLILAAPVLALHTENRGLNQLPPDAEVRRATERAQQLVEPGLLGPIHVFFDDGNAAALARERLRRIPHVASASPPLSSTDGSRFLVEVVLDVDPETTEARSAFRAVRAAADGVAAGRNSAVVVGGATAFNLDVEKALSGGLWRIVLFILAFEYVVLLLLLRSALLPLKAVFMNLLSVGAAYGVLVAVFQWGWLDWVGYDSPGYVDTIVPALVLATTFGLSMDYEVFLLTRIRERYRAGVSNERAVAEGLAASARVITAAALIMVAVFGAFALAGAPSLKELGLGLAVAIGLDATLVRLVIVPATMRLLGGWNWWFPGRILLQWAGRASAGRG
jgi:uncharacterized membrane protein YdfJ with MMPL/SSD domain